MSCLFEVELSGGGGMGGGIWGGSDAVLLVEPEDVHGEMGGGVGGGKVGGCDSLEELLLLFVLKKGLFGDFLNESFASSFIDSFEDNFDSKLAVVASNDK
jgi:hypothetical protein